MPTETLPWDTSSSFAPDLDFHDDGSYKPEPFKRKMNPRYPVDIPGTRDSDWATGWMKKEAQAGCDCEAGQGCGCKGEKQGACCGSCAEGLPCEAGGGHEHGRGDGAMWSSFDFASFGLATSQVSSDAGPEEVGGEADCCILDIVPPNDPPLQPMSSGGGNPGADPQADRVACAAAGGVWDEERCPPPPEGCCCCVHPWTYDDNNPKDLLGRPILIEDVAGALGGYRTRYKAEVPLTSYAMQNVGVKECRLQMWTIATHAVRGYPPPWTWFDFMKHAPESGHFNDWRAYLRRRRKCPINRRVWIMDRPAIPWNHAPLPMTVIHTYVAMSGEACKKCTYKICIMMVAIAYKKSKQTNSGVKIGLKMLLNSCR